MDIRREKTLRDHDHCNRHNPSFSSTLLDAICRSIDEPAANDHKNNKPDHENMIFHKQSMTRKKHFVEKKNVSSEKVVFRRKSMADSDKKVQRHRDLETVLLNSCSTSSDSSYGGGLWSSESESFSFSRLKPIRTSVSSSSANTTRPETNHKGVSFGNKTKSKALKMLRIYSDLDKKGKQPISPGGRLANFLNSIFTARNAKIKSKSSDKASSLSSTCSSASSFSRSCLSNTPSSRGTNGIKRSVRFCPVSVIVDEESRPCVHKALYENKETSSTSNSLMAVVKKSNSTINEELRLNIVSENHHVGEVARDLLKNYLKIDDSNDDEQEDEDDPDEDDAASYSSSDLFELNNLSTIGIEKRYREELPVYETTHLDSNIAIANGLIM